MRSLFPLPLLLSVVACSSRPALYLNEVQADNQSTLADGATGEYPDWIELHNGGDEPISLGGFYLTDDLGRPQQQALDARLSVAAGGFLLLWADQGAVDDPSHLNFALAKGGEDLGLFWDDPETGNLLQLDALAFGAQDPDTSWARREDGTGPWLVCATPTPGASNE
ncbi:MAG: lamin tail domain-containing protein [Pseudomonadota bacterium]